MQKLLDYDVKAILNEFQSAYASSRGEMMKIGSEEFALSSVFSYALATVISHLNRVALNRFLDTANGVSLDYIAQSFGLSRHKEPLLKARFAVGVYSNLAFNQLPLTIEIDGITYNKQNERLLATSGLYLVLYKSNQLLNRIALSTEELLAKIVQNIPSALHSRIEVYGTEYPSGLPLNPDGTPSVFPYTFDGDSAFRAYIQRHSNIISGTASYYEDLLNDIHPALKQVYCIRQFEPGYLTGYVKLVYLLKPTKQTTFPKQDVASYKVSMDIVNTILIEDLLDDVRDDGRYHALGSEFRYQKAEAKTAYPHIEAVYDGTKNEPIDGSFDWFASGVHKHVWTPSQCHYTVIHFYYMQGLSVLGRKLNTSELSALLLKPVQEIEGLEEWCKTAEIFDNPEVLPAMYRNAVGVRAKLTYRVSLTNLNATIVDAEIAPDYAYQVVRGAMETTPATGSRATEIALIRYA